MTLAPPPRLPTRPGTVLFDLDGTLLDSSRPVRAAWGAALVGMGLATLPDDELHRVIGPPMQLVAPTLLAERGRTDAAAVVEVVRRFREAIHDLEVEQALAYPGALDVVRACHADGRRLAVVTSKPRQSALRVLPALGVEPGPDGWFVHVEAPDQARPEPKDVTLGRALHVLAAAGGVDPTDTVLVGDRHHDVDAGIAHGVATIGVTWGGFGTRAELIDAGAALVVDTPPALADALGLRGQAPSSR